MMRTHAEAPPHVVFLVAAPSLLALALALLMPGRQPLFLALLLVGGALASLLAAPRILRCLPGWRGIVLSAVLALPLLLPLLAGLLSLALARALLLWRCRHMPEGEAALLAPGFPLVDAALVLGAALAAVSTW